MKLPVMQCDDGCGECCGVVPVTTKDYNRIERYAKEHGITPKRQGITCPFYQGGRCVVHPVRPVICKAFGHSESMPCAKGYNVNVPERKIRRMVDRAGVPDRLLHEVLVGGEQLALDEIKRLVE